MRMSLCTSDSLKNSFKLSSELNVFSDDELSVTIFQKKNSSIEASALSWISRVELEFKFEKSVAESNENVKRYLKFSAEEILSDDLIVFWNWDCWKIDDVFDWVFVLICTQTLINDRAESECA